MGCGCMGMASIVYNTLRLTLFFIVMITGLLLTNIALLLNLMILPFSRRLFHYLGPRIPQTWCCFCLFYLKKYLHFNFKYDTPSLNSIERAVVVTNHQSMFDIAVLYYFGFISGKGHNLRWLGKKSFKYTPLLGWGGWWSGTLMFLHRNWARDREQLTADLKSFNYFSSPVLVHLLSRRNTPYSCEAAALPTVCSTQKLPSVPQSATTTLKRFHRGGTYTT